VLLACRGRESPLGTRVRGQVGKKKEGKDVCESLRAVGDLWDRDLMGVGGEGIQCIIHQGRGFCETRQPDQPLVGMQAVICCALRKSELKFAREEVSLDNAATCDPSAYCVDPAAKRRQIAF
jgi:hypothetical protein